MKRHALLLVAIFISNFAFAQAKNFKATIDNFQKNYNANQYDEIFNNFSSEMKNALPLEKTTGVLSGLKSQLGTIESMEFLNYLQESTALYKTKFEKATMVVNMSLNDQNQISGFYVQPYTPPTGSEKATVNALSSYPKEIADLVFSRTKDLPNNAQLSIAITQYGKTNYYGIVKVNDTIKPAENQKKYFEIGSLTKVFTSTVLASLVEEKKIKLTDEINSYYPFAFNGNIKLTFESLANHTSGLPRLPENFDSSNLTNPYKNYGKTEIETYLKDFVKRENKSSPAYSYSNIAAGILGYTLGLSQKTTFKGLLQKRVFDKYKMTSSVTSAQNLGNSLVKGLNKKGEIVSNWDFDALFSAGGIISTTEDLTKFTTAQFNPKNKELELTRKTTFTINGDTKIGLGWHITEPTNGEKLFWHNGATGGYSSSITLKVIEKRAVVILSNVAGINNAIDPLAYDLINTTNKQSGK